MTDDDIQNFLAHASVGAVMPMAAPTSMASNRFATVATPPQGMPANSWPMFPNDMARNIAIDTGTYDPNYPSPLAKAAALAAAQDQTNTLAASSAAQSKAFPLTAATTPQEILQSQLAGDSYGDIKQVLQHLQGGDPRNTIIPNSQLKPFVPVGGYGGKPSEDSLTSKLDFNLINDPHFQSVLADDPKRGKFVYQHLTGRDYDTDVDVHNKTTTAQAKIGIDYTTRALSQGAKLDPATGEWLVPQTIPGDAASALPGQDARPVLKYVKPNPEQANWLNTYYSNVTRKSLPVMSPSFHQGQQHVQEQLAALPEEDKAKATAALLKVKTDTGLTPTPVEALAIIANQTGQPSWWDKTLQTFDQTGRAIMGYQQGDTPVTTDNANEIPRNTWGNIVDETARQFKQVPSYMGAFSR